MVAAVEFVEVDEVGVSLLGPAPRGLVELSREHADGGRDLDVLRVEEAECVLPVEATRGDAGVRHPRHRDVVEDLVAGQAVDRVAGERAHDVLEAVRVVIEHPGGEGDRRIGQPVQRLRAIPHLERVADALGEEEAQSVVGALLVG